MHTLSPTNRAAALHEVPVTAETNGYKLGGLKQHKFALSCSGAPSPISSLTGWSQVLAGCFPHGGGGGSGGGSAVGDGGRAPFLPFSAS